MEQSNTDNQRYGAASAQSNHKQTLRVKHTTEMRVRNIINPLENHSSHYIESSYMPVKY